jgi:hypothetical protein
LSVKKRFFARHAKSSAALVSLAIHAVLLVVAISFVAVTVIQKKDTEFEAKPVNRPKMQLKKLQVPVNIQKKRVKQPRLRKRIVVQPKLNQNVPDIKMPEITGVKGGLGTASGGFGVSGGIGFTMPEVELFGIKSKGEKVFIILDSSADMMYDEMGGIPAYTIIKEELIRILGGLPPTTLFNVIVFDSDTYMLFPDMTSANSENIAKVKDWLEPLNAVNTDNAGRTRYGTGTLGRGGSRNNEDLKAGEFRGQPRFYRPVMLAMKNQADSIFLLTYGWDTQAYVTDGVDRDEWYQTSAGRRYLRNLEEARRLLQEENKKRAERGEPPRVLSGKSDLLSAYFPNSPRPPRPQKYRYSAKDYIEAMQEIREKYRPEDVQLSSGIRRGRGSNDKFSLNVIHFRKKGERESDGHLLQLARLAGGEYEIVAGLDAIESYISARPDSD